MSRIKSIKLLEGETLDLRALTLWQRSLLKELRQCARSKSWPGTHASPRRCATCTSRPAILPVATICSMRSHSDTATKLGTIWAPRMCPQKKQHNSRCNSGSARESNPPYRCSRRAPPALKAGPSTSPGSTSAGKLARGGGRRQLSACGGRARMRGRRWAARGRRRRSARGCR